MNKILAISPAGHLHINALAEEDLSNQAQHTQHSQQIKKAFAISQANGLVALAAVRNTTMWSAECIYWRELVVEYLNILCRSSAHSQNPEPVMPPDEQQLTRRILALPPMAGAEYCTPTVLKNIWLDFDRWVLESIQGFENGLKGFITHYLPHWHQLGRVCFHLAENKQEPEYPFAFLATYASHIGKNGRVVYQALSQALKIYAGEGKKKHLLHLLEPVYAASKRCTWVKELLDAGDIYHPLAWSAAEAYTLLKSITELEESGLVVRLPDWWKKRPRPQVQVNIGNTKQNAFGIDALLDFDVKVALGDQALTADEIAAILAADDGLIFLRGQWVEIDRAQLKEALDHWENVASESEDGLSFIEGMRLLAGAQQDLSGARSLGEGDKTWVYVEAGDWLQQILTRLRQPQILQQYDPGDALQVTLRPYQQLGVNWLMFLTELGLGACLADDMGLGKTVQVITVLLIKKQQNEKQRNKKQQDRKSMRPSLLILPASLLSNWKTELQAFAPSLKAVYLHTSEMSAKELDKIAAYPEQLRQNVDLVFTTYSTLLRQQWLQQQSWELVILDEAQAIKNPTARQTKAVKELNGRARIALTGTPVENRLGDLWSLFDFLSPGLLGSAARFKKFVKALEQQAHQSFAPLRQLVQPYILRRLKTDPRVISDLPEKTEVIAWCTLSKVQVKYYRQVVKALSKSLEENTGIKRRGVVLSSLMRLKQICNHPSQMLGDGVYTSTHSGKFSRLREICEEIASRQEKVLIFTQFREMTEPLAQFLSPIFSQPGLILHGGTPVKQRKKLVDRFQNEIEFPFFVLSLKTAGTGLNLTAANHVIHFDRWWNPAVENQATDRAFRIGQKRNVLVHKFVCRGSVEEKIDRLINEKSQLAADVLTNTGGAMLTELDDKSLIDLVSLDIEQTQF